MKHLKGFLKDDLKALQDHLTFIEELYLEDYLRHKENYEKYKNVLSDIQNKIWYWRSHYKKL
tara:strand:+ start:88 stop:273 length:186 start_codon:yes stop_codon:yes gene_type:complete